MKKLFYILAAVAVTMWACQKPNAPEQKDNQKPGGEEQKPDDDEKPDTKDELTLISDAVVNLNYDSEIITVKFTSSAAWTAEADEFIALKDKSGDAGENIELKATVQSLDPEESIGRVGSISIKAGGKEIVVGVMQGKVFFFTPQEATVDVKGGKVEFQVITNQEYEFKTYDAADAAFPWAPVTYDKATGKGSLDVAANGDYDARYAYIKFTVPGIQVPAYDDEGNPTGETEDYVTRFYVYQAGNAKVEWAVSLKEPFSATSIETDVEIHDATASVALFDGKLLVSDSYTVFAFDPATGASTSISVPEDLPVQSITNDDAGNLLLATLIPYGGVGSVYAVKATDTQMANPVRLIPWVNEAWSGSHGADKVAAKGDVFGNGVVTMMYGGVGSYSGLSYCLAWEIKDGAADVFDYNEWNKSSHRINNDAWFTTPELGDDLWLSNRAVFVPAGPSVSDGFFYAGYDGLYNLYYYNGSEWNAIVEGVGDWDGSIMGMGSTEWNGKKILAGARLGYTFEWGPMPSSLWIIDVTDVNNPVVLSQSEFVGLDDQAITGWNNDSTTDVILKVEGNNLVAYLVDTSHGILMKKSYPKL